MNSNFTKRAVAYIIDIVILSMILSLFTMFIPENKNIEVINKQIGELSEQVANNTVTSSIYFNQYSSYVRDLDKELFISNLLDFVLIIGYFVILPYYYNGQTLGKKLMKIKIVKENGELTINNLLLRSVITNGIVSTIIGLVIIFVFPDLAYFWTISILGFIQFLLVIISVFMILYRKDKKGLQDIVCKTIVVEENYEVK